MFPDIKEKDFLGEGGYRVDDKAGKVYLTRSFQKCQSMTCTLPFDIVKQAVIRKGDNRMPGLTEAASWKTLLSVRPPVVTGEGRGSTAIGAPTLVLREECGTGLQALLECLMYKLSYYRYAEASLMTTGQPGFDRVRNAQIGKMDIDLEYFEEVSSLFLRHMC